MELIDRYKELTKDIYNGMPTEKQRNWTYEFIFDSLSRAEAYFQRESMTNEAEYELKVRIHRLKNIHFILNNYYQGTDGQIEKSEFLRIAKYALECNNQIIEQIMDLTFNHDMTSEERQVQLSSVIPNYIFTEFELKKIIEKYT